MAETGKPEPKPAPTLAEQQRAEYEAFVTGCVRWAEREAKRKPKHVKGCLSWTKGD